MIKTETPLVPTVSIGMPVYNGERYLRAALDSVIAQTYADYELIVSDNASTDGTEAICIEYAKNYAQIKYTRQATNLGGHANFRFVTANARGKFITWLAHDDLLEPQFLQEAVAFMFAHPEVVLVASDFTIIDDSGTHLGIEELTTVRAQLKWEQRIAEFFQIPISNVFFCIYGLMRTDICQHIQMSAPEPKTYSASELPILARFALAGEVASIPLLLRKYRKHAASVFMTEVAGLKLKSSIHRTAITIRRLIRLQIEQWKLLWFSSLATRVKFKTTASVLLNYWNLFVSRVFQRPLRKMRIKLGLKSNRLHRH